MCIAAQRAENHNENKEKIAICHAKCYQNNKAKILTRKSDYNQNNKQKIALRKAEYAQNNREESNHYHRQYIQSRSNNDVKFRITHNTRSVIYKVLKGQFISLHSKEVLGIFRIIKNG